MGCGSSKVPGVEVERKETTNPTDDKTEASEITGQTKEATNPTSTEELTTENNVVPKPNVDVSVTVGVPAKSPQIAYIDVLRQMCLKAHNEKRAKHGARPLVLSDDLNQMAQTYADHLGKTGTFEHSTKEHRRGAGENLAAHSHLYDNSGEVITNMWYDEIELYDFNNQGFKKGTGHFTQVVWTSTKEIGVGIAKSEKQGMYKFVANYRPAGNVIGTFERNVRPDSEEHTFQRTSSELMLRMDLLRQAFLDAHNVKRAKHGAQPLILSDDLNEMAQTYADHLGETGKFEHSTKQHRRGVGENLAAHSELHDNSGEEITNMWYDEIEQYDFNNQGFVKGTGHFTQVVWTSTKEIGVGIAKSEKQGMYKFVANYRPAGNVIGTFERNVRPDSEEHTFQRTSSELMLRMDLLRQAFLDAHNAKRAKHGARPLILSDDLNEIAQTYADHLGETGKFEYSVGSDVGENLAAHSELHDNSGEEITNMWYDEIEQYDFNNQGFVKGTGHFTQVVWTSTKEIGVGIAKSEKQGMYKFVANYRPAGNVIGTFERNVRPDSEEHTFQRTSSELMLRMDLLRQAFLDAHNVKRAKHGARPLILRDDLNEMAQTYADHLGETGKFEHSTGQHRRGAGENLAAHSELHDNSGEEITNMWYDEIEQYDFNNQGFVKGTGHFTQVVWKSTKEIGVGIAKSEKQGMYMFVANYRPYGNLIGSFEQNVQPLSYEE